MFDDTPCWLKILPVPAESNDLLTWLTEPGSLTARLRALNQGEVRVQVLRQGYFLATPDEMLRLNLVSQSCHIREVILYVGETPWVFARTLFPYENPDQASQFTTLKNQSLGDLLFREPKIVRDQIEVAALSASMSLYQAAISYAEHHATLWARRSVFGVNVHDILVTEVFLLGVRDVETTKILSHLNAI